MKCRPGMEESHRVRLTDDNLWSAKQISAFDLFLSLLLPNLVAPCPTRSSIIDPLLLIASLPPSFPFDALNTNPPESLLFFFRQVSRTEKQI